MSDEEADLGGRGRQSKFQNERRGGGGGGGRGGFPNTYGEYKEFKRARTGDSYSGPPPHQQRRDNYRDRGSFEPPGKRPRYHDQHDDRSRGRGGGERGRMEAIEPGYQPSMLTFKAFLSNQDDTITEEDAMHKYGEYKVEFKRQQLNEFFVTHKADEWFKERFHPSQKDLIRTVAVAGRVQRAQVFWELYDKVSKVRLDADMQEELVVLMDTIVIKLEGGSEEHIKNYLDKKDEVDEIEIKRPKYRDDDPIVKVCEDTKTNIGTDDQSKLVEERSLSDSGEVEDDDKDVTDDNDESKSKEDTKNSASLSEDSNMSKSSEANIEDDLELSGDEQVSDELDEVAQMDGNDTVTNEGESVEMVGGAPETAVVEGDVINQDGEEVAEQEDDGELEEESDVDPANISSVLQVDGAQDDVELKDDLLVDPMLVEPPLNTPEPVDPNKPLRKNLHSTVSIHLRNIPATITKTELESVCFKYDGFLRVALSDPTPDRKWSRRGWITFAKGCNIKEICCSLGEVRLGGVELGPVINRELSKRVRLVGGLVNDKKVVRNDIKLASKIIQNMDNRWGLSKEVGGDKLISNISDYLVEEASAEEDELLGVSREEGEVSGGMVMVQREEELMSVLDRLIMYLRVVHSVDFYNHSEYPYEDQMPNRLGLIHARGPLPKDKLAQQEIDDYVQNFEKKIGGFLAIKEDLTEKEMMALGGKMDDEEVEKFILLNSQELSKDKWLCPLSGKKFKGPEFIRKHLMSKFIDRVEQVKADVQYFNNYLRDPKRPQLPEKSKANRPSSGGGGNRRYEDDRPGSGGGYREATSYPVYERGRGGWDRPAPHYRGGGGHNRGWGGPVRDRIGYNARGGNERLDPRAVVDYSDVDSPMDW